MSGLGGYCGCTNGTVMNDAGTKCDCAPESNMFGEMCAQSCDACANTPAHPSSNQNYKTCVAGWDGTCGCVYPFVMQADGQTCDCPLDAGGIQLFGAQCDMSCDTNCTITINSDAHGECVIFISKLEVEVIIMNSKY